MFSRRELSLLRALYLHGTVTAAAQAVHISQPAASALLKGLEVRAGFALFQRDRRRLTLTSQGRALMPEVLNAMSAVEAADRLALDIRRGATTRVNVGAVAVVSAMLLPQALEEVRQTYPQAAVTVRAGTAVDIMEMVADHRIDLGVVIARGESTNDRLDLQLLAPLGLYAVFGPASRLARRKGRLSWTAMAEEGLIVLAPSLPAGLATQRMLADQGLDDRPVLEVSQSFTACEFAGQGLGVAVVETLGARYAQRRGLTVRHLCTRKDFQLNLVTSHERPVEGAAMCLRDALVAAIRRVDARPW